jgi:hypothetical protein
MASYKFKQLCRPCGDFRISEVISFLSLIQKAFEFPEYFDDKSNALLITPENLEVIFDKNLSKIQFPETGTNETFFSLPPSLQSDDTLGVDILQVHG